MAGVFAALSTRFREPSPEKLVSGGDMLDGTIPGTHPSSSNTMAHTTCWTSFSNATPGGRTAKHPAERLSHPKRTSGRTQICLKRGCSTIPREVPATTQTILRLRTERQMSMPRHSLHAETPLKTLSAESTAKRNTPMAAQNGAEQNSTIHHIRLTSILALGKLLI